MHTNELPPHYERPEVVSEVRAFLQTEINNAHFVGKGISRAHEDAITQPLADALADLDKGDYKTTLAILERYHSMLRDRADDEIGGESLPADANMTANRISMWIDTLRSLSAAQ